MPVYAWTVRLGKDPSELIKALEAQGTTGEASALLHAAVACVDSLHDLDDIDRSYDSSRSFVGGHRPDVVDVAHARWATSTCITSLDLCAAVLGRAFCGEESDTRNPQRAGVLA